MSAVVVVLDVNRDGGAEIAAGVELARRHGTRLEVVWVQSPVRELLLETGRSLAPASFVGSDRLECDLDRAIARALDRVPADVPTRSRLVRGGRRDALAAVDRLAPVAVVAVGRFGRSHRRARPVLRRWRVSERAGAVGPTPS